MLTSEIQWIMEQFRFLYTSCSSAAAGAQQWNNYLPKAVRGWKTVTPSNIWQREEVPVEKLTALRG